MHVVTVVVVVFNIPREAPRTLFSLSADYQREIDAADYEVLVVDNGSSPPFDPAAFGRLRGNFRLIRIDNAPPSPAHAVNRGLAEARGEIIGVLIDGARLVTPGLLHFARLGASSHPRAVVASLGWYLGGDMQGVSTTAGYTPAREDALLSSIDWPADGYRLFEIGTIDESSVDPASIRTPISAQRHERHGSGRDDEEDDGPPCSLTAEQAGCPSVCRRRD